MWHSRFSWLQKVILVFGLGITVALVTRINWAYAMSEGALGSAFTTFVAAVVIALLPYAALWQFLGEAANYRSLQIAGVAAVGLIGLIGYTYFWSLNTPTGGWELFIVFFWQSVAICCLYLAAKVLRYVSSRSHT